MSDPTAPSPPLPFAFVRQNRILVRDEHLVVSPSASPSAIAEARRVLSRAFPVRDVDEAEFSQLMNQQYADPAGPDGTGETEIRFDLDEDGGGSAADRDLLDDPVEAPVIELVNQMLRRALRAGASDLHIEPLRSGMRARIRLDGILRPLLEREDVPVRRVVSRIKIMAGLDTSETRLPQDGRMSLRFGGRVVDLRFASLPGQHGERLALRLLDRSAGLPALPDLGLSRQQEQELRRLSAMPNGILLVTGPTGSGKTTTLYALLAHLDRIERNVVTVEDPIEYELEGVSQSQVHPEIGLDFAAVLRAVLRQDPDVILVGEIRDPETARIAAQAAQTGHLVLSTLHTNTALGAVTRLRDLEVEDYLIAASLRGVLGQRLLRRLCNLCARPAEPCHELRSLCTAEGIELSDLLRSAGGCIACGQTGYAGRVGIHELATITPGMQLSIGAGASEAVLTRAALDGGMSTLLRSALGRVARGETDLPELRRVLGSGLWPGQSATT